MMYMVGGGSSRVHRGNRPYPGARRFLQPPKPPINWRRIIGHTVLGLTYGALLALLTFVMALGL